MTRLTDVVALLGIDLVSVAVLSRFICCWFPVALRANTPSGRFNGRVAAVLMVVLAALWIPAEPSQLPLLAYVRGISADFSFTSLLLAGVALYQQLWRQPKFLPNEVAWVFVATIMGACVLYPTALGWGDWDAYRAGWGSYMFLFGLASTALVAFCAGLWLLPLVLATSALAWAIGLLESNNIWDYLMDPWLVLLACLRVISIGIANLRKPMEAH